MGLQPLKIVLIAIIIISLSIIITPSVMARMPTYHAQYPPMQPGWTAGSVTGRVTTQNTTIGLGGAYVAIVDDINNSIEYSNITSDGLGYYQFTGVNATAFGSGRYQVYANCSPYGEGYSHSFDVTSSSTSTTAVVIFTKTAKLDVYSERSYVNPNGVDNITITAHAYDAMGNKVGDGTPVYFTITNDPNNMTSNIYGSLNGPYSTYKSSNISIINGVASIQYGWIPKPVSGNIRICVYYAVDPKVNGSIIITPSSGPLGSGSVTGRVTTVNTSLGVAYAYVAVVSASSPHQVLYETVSDAGGYYQITNVSATVDDYSYILYAKSGGYGDGYSTPFGVYASATATTSVVISPSLNNMTGGVTGRVTTQNTANGIAGAYVEIVDSSNHSRVYYSTTSDTNGYYSFAGIDNSTGFLGTGEEAYCVYANKSPYGSGLSHSFGIWPHAVSTTSVVIFTMPANIQLTADNDRINSDGASYTNISAYVTDAFGNPVGDGTPINFVLGDMSRGMGSLRYIDNDGSASGMDITTRGGYAKLRFGWASLNGMNVITATSSANPAVNASISITIRPLEAITIHVPADYPTIQDAIDAAWPGDTIIVDSGTYYENVVVNKKVNLLGYDTGSGMPIVDGGGFASSCAVNITADGAQLQGFNVTHAIYGINVYANFTWVSGNIVTSRSDGISLFSANDSVVTANTVHNVANAIGVGYANNTTVIGNTIDNANMGVEIILSNNTDLTSNTVRNSGNGILLVGTNFTPVTGNTISNNTYGLTSLGSSFISITSNLANNNSAVGIGFANTYFSTVIGNIANQNNFSGIIVSSSSNVNVSGNTANENTVFGLTIYNSTLNAFSNNTICNNKNSGIWINDSISNILWLNHISGNGINANITFSAANIWNSTAPERYTYNGHQLLNYTGNYWGDYMGKDVNIDGIGDMPYPIDTHNVDNYPMISTPPISGPDATFISGTIPDTMVAGETYNVKVNFTNTGTTPWTSGDILVFWGQTWNFNLMNDTSIGNLPAFSIPSGVTVQPGHTYSWNLTLTPQWPGSFSMGFQVVDTSTGKWLGNYSGKSMIVYPAIPDSLYVSNNIPDTMITGITYHAMINFTNTGNTTWTSGKGDVLAIWGQTWNYNMNNDTSVSGLPAFSIPAGIKVLPGQTYSWNLTFVPQWPVSTSIGFQVVEQSSGKWLGNYGSKTTTVNSAIQNSAYASNSIPDTTIASDDYNVSINFTNTGNTPWSSSKGDMLVFWGQTWNFNPHNDTSVNGLPAFSIPAGVTVQPGQTYSWNLTLSPQWPGNFGIGFQVVEGSSGKWLGNYGSKTMTVFPATPNSLYVSNNLPDTMTSGQTYNVAINFTNNGNTTWTPVRGDMLVMWGQTWNLQMDNDTSLYGLPAWNIPAGITVAPGQTYSWDLSLKPQWAVSTSIGFQVVQKNNWMTSGEKWLGNYGSKTTTIN